MFPLNTLSVLEFTGHDACQFLHDQLSADIAGIAVGDAGFACYCNSAGRVLGLLLVAPRTDSLLVVCARELAGQMKDLLGRYVIRADVKIDLRSDLAVAAGIGDTESDQDVNLQTTTGMHYIITADQAGANPDDTTLAQAWKASELAAGIVWLGTASSAQFLPQMLGFESIGALSFKKGCFPGQEIIARTRYLGTLKRRPLLLHVDGTVPACIMEKVVMRAGDDNYSGVVVDQAHGTQQDQTLFIVVRAALDIQAQRVVVNDKDYAVLET